MTAEIAHPVVVAIDQKRGPLCEPISGDLSPGDHVRAALELPSPFPAPQALSPHLQRAVEELASLSREGDEHLDSFWAQRLDDLHECLRRNNDEPSYALEELLRAYNYDDPECAQLLRGSDLVGVLPGRPSWPPNVKGAECGSSSELLAASPAARVRAWQATRPSVHDATLLQAAEEDVTTGKMAGPFFADSEVANFLGSQEFTLSKRFGVPQHDKTRPCDDFSASGVNSCCRPERALTLSTLDHFFALMCSILTAFGLENLAQPEVPFFKRDMLSAYRQIWLLPGALVFGAIIFWHHVLQRPVVYVHLALPFGPRASVNSFNRVSQGITFLMQAMFALPVDSYFDDWWGAALRRLIDRMFNMFGKVMSALHLDIKVAKDVPPTYSGEILGHVANVRSTPFILENTTRRLESLRTLVSRALESNSLRPSVAGEIAGKFGFACTAIYGRVGRACLKPVYERQHALTAHDSAVGGCASSDLDSKVRPTHVLSRSLRAALLCMYRILENPQPRVVLPSFMGSRRTCVAYTDGQGAGFVAAVFFPGTPYASAYCSLKLPEDLLARFGQKNCIQQIETSAVILLFEVFKRELSDCDVRLFCDNIAEQGALIKGFSRSPSQAALCGAVWIRAAAGRVGMWIDRVRSKSNVADIPTRPDQPERFEILRSLGVRCRVPPRVRIIEQIEAELSQAGL